MKLGRPVLSGPSQISEEGPGARECCTTRPMLHVVGDATTAVYGSFEVFLMCRHGNGSRTGGRNRHNPQAEFKCLQLEEFR